MTRRRAVYTFRKLDTLNAVFLGNHRLERSVRHPRQVEQLSRLAPTLGSIDLSSYSGKIR